MLTGLEICPILLTTNSNKPCLNPVSDPLDCIFVIATVVAGLDTHRKHLADDAWPLRPPVSMGYGLNVSLCLTVHLSPLTGRVRHRLPANARWPVWCPRHRRLGQPPPPSPSLSFLPFSLVWFTGWGCQEPSRNPPPSRFLCESKGLCPLVVFSLFFGSFVKVQ